MWKKIKEFLKKFKRDHEECCCKNPAVIRGVMWLVLAGMFLLLKFFGAVDWSWVWVLCPLWIPLLFFCVAFIILLIGGLVIVSKSTACNPATEKCECQCKKEKTGEEKKEDVKPEEKKEEEKKLNTPCKKKTCKEKK